MYRRTVQALALALTLAVSAGAPSTAQATTFVPMTTENLADISTAIVEGTVVDVRAELDAVDRVWTVATVDVSRRFKGADVADTIEVWSLGGEIGRYVTHISCLACPRGSVGRPPHCGRRPCLVGGRPSDAMSLDGCLPVGLEGLGVPHYHVQVPRCPCQAVPH